MAEFTADISQSVGVNQNVLFTNEAVGGNCSIIHRETLQFQQVES